MAGLLVDPSHAVAEIRDRSTLSEVSVLWSCATTEFLSRAVPWRTFRWRDGQRHYSGTYWSATNRDHVIYESRLELARLMLADYDATVRQLIAQPFLLRARVNRRIRRHVPDFLLLTDTVPTVVDVKPLQRLDIDHGWNGVGQKQEVRHVPADPTIHSGAQQKRLCDQLPHRGVIVGQHQPRQLQARLIDHVVTISRRPVRTGIVPLTITPPESPPRHRSTQEFRCRTTP